MKAFSPAPPEIKSVPEDRDAVIERQKAQIARLQEALTEIQHLAPPPLVRETKADMRVWIDAIYEIAERALS
jgi:hypothetical protein